MSIVSHNSDSEQMKYIHLLSSLIHTECIRPQYLQAHALVKWTMLPHSGRHSVFTHFIKLHKYKDEIMGLVHLCNN